MKPKDEAAGMTTTEKRVRPLTEGMTVKGGRNHGPSQIKERPAPPSAMKPNNEPGLRERCKDHYQRMGRDAMLRQGSPVDDLTAFVASEIGRSADSKLEDTLPLCLYFSTEQDREEFLALVRAAWPDMITKHWPR